MEKNTPIEIVFELLGGITAVARHFHLTPWAVSKWRERVPSDRCIDLEKLTRGEVRCEQLRPDIDWAYLRTTSVSSRSASPVQSVLAGDSGAFSSLTHVDGRR